MRQTLTSNQEHSDVDILKLIGVTNPVEELKKVIEEEIGDLKVDLDEIDEEV